MCEKDDRLQVLFSVLQEDAPNAAIIFVNDQVVTLLPPLGLRFYAFLSRFVVGSWRTLRKIDLVCAFSDAHKVSRCLGSYKILLISQEVWCPCFVDFLTVHY